MMNNLSITITFFLISLSLSCANANDSIIPSLNTKAFPGMTIEADKVLLKGYRYQNEDLKKVTFNDCKQALNYDIANISEYSYFRFKLLITSCTAIKKFETAHNSEKSFFPLELSNNDYKSFPALGIPYLSKTQYNHRKNKSIQNAFKKISISTDRNGIKVLTKNDEFYIHILARGDFNGDKTEDLLVSSEWYARHAHGKHTDLVILSKTGKDKPITIEWRLNKPR